jgi:hypothetical protein
VFWCAKEPTGVGYGKESGAYACIDRRAPERIAG